MRAAVPASGSFAHELVEWDAWRPREIARRLGGIGAPWYVAAGWAIDLFLGGQRREHEDLEIAVPADRFAEVVNALPDIELFVVGPDPALTDPPPDGGIATPLAEAGAMLDAYHQTWALDRVARTRPTSPPRCRGWSPSGARGSPTRSRLRIPATPGSPSSSGARCRRPPR